MYPYLSFHPNQCGMNASILCWHRWHYIHAYINPTIYLSYITITSAYVYPYPLSITHLYQCLYMPVYMPVYAPPDPYTGIPCRPLIRPRRIV